MFRTVTLAAAAAAFPLSALACAGFAVDDAHARASGAMAQSGAAFMTLRNAGDDECHIVDVRSTAATRTELHAHVEDDQGVMRMVRIDDGIALPAGAEHRLARGGDHLMFLGLQRPFAQGETVEVTFVFAGGSEATVAVPVDNDRPAEGAGRGHSHGGSHSHDHSNGHSHDHSGGHGD